MNTIEAMAVAFEEAMDKKFSDYAKQVVKNAAVLANGLRARGFGVFGTENHLMVVDIGEGKGKEAAVRLEEAGIIVNANTVPHDKAGPFRPSGIRLGSPAMTTRGFDEADFERVAGWIDGVVKGEDPVRVREEIRSYLGKE